MKKTNVTENAVKAAKRGMIIMAAAALLGGCGGQGKTETTAAETSAESSAEETESVSKAEETEAESETTSEEASESAEKEESSAEETETEAAEAASEVPEEEAKEAVAEPAEAEKAAGVSPSAIYQEITGKVSLPAMIQMDDNFISNYYGINPANLDGYVFASAEDATLADSIIIMKAKDEAAVSEITGALNTVIEQKEAELENYLPEQYDIVAKSSVKTNGNYVYLVISNDAAAIEAVVSSALK